MKIYIQINLYSPFLSASLFKRASLTHAYKREDCVTESYTVTMNLGNWEENIAAFHTTVRHQCFILVLGQ